MSTNVYILKLKDNNYYVGKAKDVNKRFQEHISGNGSSWTKKHKPIEIIKIINNCSSFEEDKQVKELMSTYGIDKVRGGTYTKIDLTKEEKEILQKEIWAAQDVCTRCGNSNHFVKDCYAKTDINGNKIEEEYIIWQCEYCDKEFEDIKDCEKHEKSCKPKPKVNKKQKCNRCGRQNHNENNCYASNHVDGYELNTTDDYTSSDDECSIVLDIVENTIKQTDCFRCGRKGHFVNECYAIKHVKGYYIN
jgi:predicted GIY-YIG superfamily endonuclease